MAKKKGVNRSQLIRDAMAANPDATPAEIAQRLKKYKITAAYVSRIKFSMKAKNKKTGRKPGRPAKGASRPAFTVSSLLKAKQLAEELGGVEQAKSVLDVVAKLTD